MSESKLLQRNIEIKARLPDRQAAIAAAKALGAKFVGTMVQTDTYFRIPSGRLKLREIEGDRAEMIYYDRPDRLEARTSRYWLTRLTSAEEMKLLLTAALGVRTVVHKRREVWLWQNVRIHIDQVDQLGDFIELEAVIGSAYDPSRSSQNLQRVQAALAIDPAAPVAGSYVDLVIAVEEHTSQPRTDRN